MPACMDPVFLKEKLSEELKERAESQRQGQSNRNHTQFQVIPGVNEGMPRLYLNSKERQKCLVRDNDKGVLVNSNGVPLVGTYLYAMSLEGKLYATQERNAHHSYLLAGESTICAGCITINKQGKLTDISNESGHYKPDFNALIDACRVMSIHYQQQDFSFTDHSVLSRHNSSVNSYDSADFLSDGSLRSTASVMPRSRSQGTGLNEHKSRFFKTAERKKVELTRKDKQSSLTELERKLLENCNRVLGKKSCKSLLTDYKSSSKAVLKEIRDNDPGTDSNGYILEAPIAAR